MPLRAFRLKASADNWLDDYNRMESDWRLGIGPEDLKTISDDLLMRCTNLRGDVADAER